MRILVVLASYNCNVFCMYHVLELCIVLSNSDTCDEATAQSLLSSGCVDLLVQQLRAQTSDDFLIMSLKCTLNLLAWPRACDFFTQAGAIAPLVHTISHHVGVSSVSINVRVLALEVLDVRHFISPSMHNCNTCHMLSPAAVTTFVSCVANGALLTRFYAALLSQSPPTNRSF